MLTTLDVITRGKILPNNHVMF